MQENKRGTQSSTQCEPFGESSFFKHLCYKEGAATNGGWIFG